jgi:hypothetical protein
MIAGLLYALATGADIVTTTVALHLGLHEGNPLVAPMISQHGILPQVAVSAVLCAALYWYAVHGGRKLVFVLAILRWAVVFNNAAQLAAVATIVSHAAGLF